MSEDNQDKLSTWKSWLIKKLLKGDSSKEEILNIIASEEESNDEKDNADDNNEKNLIKNILQLENKSVEDVMVPRGEIISIDIKQDYDQIFEIIKEEFSPKVIFNTESNASIEDIKDIIELKNV